jgi:predicted nuclease of predicted toxin-antitoxin system
MKFLLDESADLRLADRLKDLGHDVKSVAADFQVALPDSQVLSLAHQEQRILITNDKDFGELVFRHRRPHAGVILFRLPFGASLTSKLDRLDHVLTVHAHSLDLFIVVTQRSVRVRR